MSETVPLQGACLYLPATHSALSGVVCGDAVPGLRTAVVCLEDALASSELPAALQRLRGLASHPAGPKIYVRPRNLSMLHELLTWNASLRWDGFVLPKLSLENMAAWLTPLARTHFRVMPILETEEVFDPFKVREMCDLLTDAAWGDRIEVVRIGATDLFSAIGTRRPRSKTVYESVLGVTVKQVATQLMARGLFVSAPVCEAIADTEVLLREIQADVEAGFVGKTAIHPKQVQLINEAFRVDTEELHEAHRILSAEQPVFQSRGTMCESRPHSRWAQRVVARAHEFGVRVLAEDSPLSSSRRAPNIRG